MKKVLIVSPTPTHPTNAGNRIRIKSIVDMLLENNFDVDFFYIELEGYDVEQMKNYWEDKLVIAEKKLLSRSSFISKFLAKIRAKASNVYRLILLKLGYINENQFKYNHEIDEFFPKQVLPLLKKISSTKKYDIVICEYVAMSKVLTLFNKKTFKVIDTHDKFTDRFEIYLNNQIIPSWYSFYRDQEKKGLSRANLILSIQEDEKSYFEELTPKKVISIPSMSKVKFIVKRNVFEKKLLYFASDNELNIKTINHFIDNIFPLIYASDRDVSLLIGGKISEKISSSHTNIKLLGQFNDPLTFYEQGDIVINPEWYGTGLKVKTLEALSYGMPLVTTLVGSKGIFLPELPSMLIADSAQTFSEKVILLCQNKELRLQLAVNALKNIEEIQTRYQMVLTENLIRTQ